MRCRNPYCENELGLAEIGGYCCDSCYATEQRACGTCDYVRSLIRSLIFSKLLWLGIIVSIGFVFFAYKTQAQQIEQGQGIICNTPEQLQSFLQLLNEGVEEPLAIEQVNKEVNVENACGIAIVAYIRGESITTTTIPLGVVEVVKLAILATWKNMAWITLPRPVVQFSYFLLERGTKI